MNPASPSATDEIPMVFGNTQLDLSVRTLLDGHKGILYVFRDPGTYNDFFVSDLDANGGGGTFHDVGTTRPVYISLMENCTSCAGVAGYHSVSSDQLKENTAHEVGHAADLSLGISNGSFHATYNTRIRQDFYKLDYDVDDSSQNNNNRRHPCQTGRDGLPGPFVGVEDESDVPGGGSVVPFCDQGDIRAKYKINGVRKSNSLILKESTPGIWFQTEYPVGSGTLGWWEPYSAAFAFRAFTSGPAYPQFLRSTNGT